MDKDKLNEAAGLETLYDFTEITDRPDPERTQMDLLKDIRDTALEVTCSSNVYKDFKAQDKDPDTLARVRAELILETKKLCDLMQTFLNSTQRGPIDG